MRSDSSIKGKCPVFMYQQLLFFHTHQSSLARTPGLPKSVTLATTNLKSILLPKQCLKASTGYLLFLQEQYLSDGAVIEKGTIQL